MFISSCLETNVQLHLLLFTFKYILLYVGCFGGQSMCNSYSVPTEKGALIISRDFWDDFFQFETGPRPTSGSEIKTVCFVFGILLISLLFLLLWVRVVIDCWY